MTLPASGQISLSQVNTELGLTSTAQISLGDTNVRTLAGVTSGAISMSNLHGKSSEYVVTLSAGVGPLLSSLFPAEIWGDANIKKRAIIPEGVEIGASYGGHALATSASANGKPGSWAGQLIIDNYGIISGIGGTANSGTGGTAFLMTFPGRNNEVPVLNNYGTLRGGGGGGGRGGNGGAGVITTTEGPFFSTNTNLYYWGNMTAGTQPGVHIYWNRNVLSKDAGIYYGPLSGVTTSYAAPDGWTYIRGAYQDTYTSGSSTTQRYAVSRSQNESTTGGIGGDGARGQGYDGAAGTGVNGTAGGTNAGAGGKGGNGGGWGTAGQTGANGASGNAGSGTAGATGGLAGFYVNAQGQPITINNFGTVQGRLN